MKIIATLTPDDVKPVPYQVRCLTATCFRATMPALCLTLEQAQSVAEVHVREQRHAVVIEETEP